MSKTKIINPKVSDNPLKTEAAKYEDIKDLFTRKTREVYNRNIGSTVHEMAQYFYGVYDQSTNLLDATKELHREDVIRYHELPEELGDITMGPIFAYRTAILSEHLMFTVEYKKVDGIDRNHYYRLLAKKFNQLVEDEVLDFGLFSPISSFPLVSKRISDNRMFGTISLSEPVIDPATVPDEDVMCREIFYVFVFPSMKVTNEMRLMNQDESHVHLNKLAKVQIFYSEGELPSNDKAILEGLNLM